MLNPIEAIEAKRTGRDGNILKLILIIFLKMIDVKEGEDVQVDIKGKRVAFR